MNAEQGTPHSDGWVATVQEKARALHSQIAALEKWASDAGANSELLASLTAPYYSLLDSLYQEDFPLARAIETSDLLIRLEGPAIGEQTPKVSLIVGVFADVRREIARLAKTIAGEAGIGRRVPRQMDLGLAAIARGSLFMGFTIPTAERGEQVDLFQSDERLRRAAEEAVGTLGSVARNIVAGAGIDVLAEVVPDPGVRDAALFAVEKLAPSGRKGIQVLGLGGKQMPDGALYRLTPEIRARVKLWVEAPVRGDEMATFSGVVREIDLDSKRFEIRRVEESQVGYIRCAYGSTLSERAARQLLDKRVRITGRFERSISGKPRLLQADNIEELP